MRKTFALFLCILALGTLAYGEPTDPVRVKAGFTCAPLIPEAGELVQFIDKSTGPIEDWRWNFGDHATGRGPNPTHVYAKPGFYRVTLKVYDDHFRSRSLTLTLMVVPPTKVDFTWAPKAPVETLPVMFTDLSTGVDIVRWFWEFGDGTYSVEQNPVHVYARAGKYTVTLTIFDSEGARAQASMTI